LFNEGRGRIAIIKKIHFDTYRQLYTPLGDPSMFHTQYRKSNFEEGDVNCITIVRRILYTFPQAEKKIGGGVSPSPSLIK
jgi:hypothetical protein